MNQEFNNTQDKLVKYTSKNLSFLLNNDKIESIRIWDQEKSKNYDQPTLNDLLSIIGTNNRQKYVTYYRLTWKYITVIK